MIKEKEQATLSVREQHLGKKTHPSLESLKDVSPLCPIGGTLLPQ